ncbi:MAG: hypothetical protein QOG19_2862 [Mycobacterium sp.]|jgi:hypothetical protein|nr:hypothetical protein [Mycobacterium sp.]
MTEKMTEHLCDVFDIAHAYLASLSVCDSSGGGEYTRVRLEWESYPADQRPDVIPFISDRSNGGPYCLSAYQPERVREMDFFALLAANDESGRLEALEDLIDALHNKRAESGGAE